MVVWSTQAWSSVASSVLSVGNVRSCNHTAAVKHLVSLGESSNAIMTGIVPRSLAPFFSFRVGRTLRLMNFPRVTWEFVLATKKAAVIPCTVVCHRVHVQFLWCCISWPRFCDLVFCGFFTASFTEVRIYVSTTYRVRVVYMFTLVPRVLRFNSPVFVSLFSNPFMQFHCPLALKISTSSLAQRWLHYCWGHWCFAW